MNATAGTISIYVLIDPRDGEVRYVGKTNNNRQRYQMHASCACRNTSNKDMNAWFADLRKCGLRPVMRTVEEVAPENARAAELRCIRRYMLEGANLLNKVYVRTPQMCSDAKRGVIKPRQIFLPEQTWAKIFALAVQMDTDAGSVVELAVEKFSP